MLAFRYVDRNDHEKGFQNESKWETYTKKLNNAATTR